jgi:glutathione S-transferase
MGRLQEWASTGARLPFYQGHTVKLYYHPVSTTSRPVLLLAADDEIAIDYEVIDLLTGAHLEPGFKGINPSQQVPVLEDGDFRLTESSAILKYLAEKTGSASYPKDLRSRARVNERMDWFNTGFYRELGYGVIYPQIFPNYKRADPAAQQAHLAWGREKARRWLTILDQDIIGSNAYVCGEQLTIADYLGIGMVSLGEVTRFDYTEWPNLSRWIATMKARPSWQRVHENFYTQFVVAYASAPFVTLGSPS